MNDRRVPVASRLGKKEQSRGSIGATISSTELATKKSQHRFKLISSVVESSAVAEESVPHTARTKPTTS